MVKPLKRLKASIDRRVAKPISKFVQKNILWPILKTFPETKSYVALDMKDQDLTKIVDPNSVRGEEMSARVTRFHNEIRAAMGLPILVGACVYKIFIQFIKVFYW